MMQIRNFQLVSSAALVPSARGLPALSNDMLALALPLRMRLGCDTAALRIAISAAMRRQAAGLTPPGPPLRSG